MDEQLHTAVLYWCNYLSMSSTQYWLAYLWLKRRPRSPWFLFPILYAVTTRNTFVLFSIIIHEITPTTHGSSTYLEQICSSSWRLVTTMSVRLVSARRWTMCKFSAFLWPSQLWSAVTWAGQPLDPAALATARPETRSTLSFHNFRNLNIVQL